MDLATQKRLLMTLTAGFALAAAGAIPWALGDLGSASEARETTDRPLVAAEASPADENSARATSPVDYSLPLQQSLADRPKPKPPPPPPPKVVRQPTPVKPKAPKLDWTLVGTIIDSDRSVAILIDGQGKTDIRRAGEEVELTPPGVLVRKISSDKVTLDLKGKESTLKLNQSFSGGGGAKSNERSNRRRDR